VEEKAGSCKTCTYYHREQCNRDVCTWFTLYSQEAKAIPSHVLDRGCRFYCHGDEHPLLRYAIKIFNGKSIA
jgi:hypothetical protein